MGKGAVQQAFPRPLGSHPAPPRISFVIEREQVLHVARLARLALAETEIERMSGELSSILGHVEQMNELDLGGVEPTSHVVPLTNVSRADEPRPSWPLEQVIEPAPDSDQGAFRVPSPQA
jgi:aspartyl-tRNA(Asn)/glutamyl-tRNA(Gln) amidotransferase subunit C